MLADLLEALGLPEDTTIPEALEAVRRLRSELTEARELAKVGGWSK